MIKINKTNLKESVTLSNPYLKKSFTDAFEEVRQYVEFKYGRKVDSTPDVSRACFVCHDPEAWIRPVSSKVYLDSLQLKWNPITGRKEVFADGYPSYWDVNSRTLTPKVKLLLRSMEKNGALLTCIRKLELEIF